MLAGTVEQIIWGCGNWIILDIGFSNSSRSCAVSVRDGAPKCLRFGELRAELLSTIRNDPIDWNLMIEAPLSVCFDSDGNPKRRSIERNGADFRYWYSGPGATVLLAAMYLLRDVAQAAHKVYLFEGFVSYKNRGVKYDHCGDVCLLRDVVKNPIHYAAQIISPAALKVFESDNLISAFAVMGFDCGVPPIIYATS